MEAFMYRFHPQIRWVREQIAAGAIGPVRMARGSFAFDIRTRPRDIRLRAVLDGGSLMDVGCYPLSFCRTVFGKGPDAAVARVDVPAKSEVELTVGAVLDFGSGRIGMMDSSFAQPPHQVAEVVGEAGRIVIPRPYTPGHNDTHVFLIRGDETIERRFAGTDHYRLEVEHFSDCVRTGATPEITEADSLEQARAIETIYAAAQYRWPRR
jgi:predicted dehydrogenase